MPHPGHINDRVPTLVQKPVIGPACTRTDSTRSGYYPSGTRVIDERGTTLVHTAAFAKAVEKPSFVVCHSFHDNRQMRVSGWSFIFQILKLDSLNQAAFLIPSPKLGIGVGYFWQSKRETDVHLLDWE